MWGPPPLLLQSVLEAFKKQATLPKVGAQQLEKQAFLSIAFKVPVVCLVSHMAIGDSSPLCGQRQTQTAFCAFSNGSFLSSLHPLL